MKPIYFIIHITVLSTYLVSAASINKRDVALGDSSTFHNKEIFIEIEEEEDDFNPEFPEFQNAATSEFFENLPRHKIKEIKDEIELQELDEEIDELEESNQDSEDDVIETVLEHHHAFNNNNNIPWQRFHYNTVDQEAPKSSNAYYPIWLVLFGSIMVVAVYNTFKSSNGKIQLSSPTSPHHTDLPLHIPNTRRNSYYKNEIKSN